MVVVIVMVVVRHGVFSHQGRGGSTSQPWARRSTSWNRRKDGT